MSAESSTISEQLAEATYSEKWKAGFYAYTGIFVIDGTDLTPEQANRDARHFREMVYSNRKRHMPWFLSMYFPILVYCAPKFRKDTVDYLFGGRRSICRKGKIYVILFDSSIKSIHAKEAMQNDSIIYYKYLDELFSKGVALASALFDLK